MTLHLLLKVRSHLIPTFLLNFTVQFRKGDEHKQSQTVEAGAKFKISVNSNKHLN